MSEVLVDFSHSKRARQHSLSLDKATRDALADLCRFRWPTGTAKLAAAEWGLSLDEARGVVAGRASQTTIDKIFKHKNGGWSVILPVMGEVAGQSFDQYLIEKRRAHEEQARRIDTLVGNWLSLAADRPVGDRGASGALDRGGRPLPDRTTRSGR